MVESGRPSYRELAEALSHVPSREAIQDQRLWDWWAIYGAMVARIPKVG